MPQVLFLMYLWTHSKLNAHHYFWLQLPFYKLTIVATRFCYHLSHFFPLVLGFVPSVFSGIEQRATFLVQAGFLSGKPPVGGNLDLNLVLGTAGK